MFVLETSSPSELGTEDEAPVAIGDAVILLTSLDEAVILRASFCTSLLLHEEGIAAE